ncbi:hypothetical protein M378DRAFT_14729 [Amanita muscaria Koide BX008]|uniref:DUF6589 domain-containing protein n=1 Tax=Amanita muscaria (strain Koide BX008) TaxID=946122 RepID=A0A0C2WS91_AMAMK|nr:hypothetical protein M378DRAFT_14729 [Amanita muscaria Koide BX008]
MDDPRPLAVSVLKDYGPVIQVLNENNLSLVDFITALLSEKRFKAHALTKDLLQNSETILVHILSHTRVPESAQNRACMLVERIYAHEIRNLDIEDFCLDEMSLEYIKTAPRIWSLLDALLGVRARRKSSLLLDLATGEGQNISERLATTEARDEQRLEGGSTSLACTSPDTEHVQEESRKNALSQIKKTVIVSMLMQGANRKANTFASIFGIFLHSCRTPQRVIIALQRMGLCIGRTTIHSAINSLLINTSEKLLELGKTGCIALAYDNFDVDLKTSTPVVEKTGDSLRHLTSGLMFVLQHGVKSEDLRFSDYLWQRSEYNPVNIGKPLSRKTYYDLLELCHEDGDADIEDSREIFNTWVFLRDLVEHVDGFDNLRTQLKEPDVIEQIPVAKTDIYPAYAMDVNNSTVSGNIQAIELLMAQVGYGSPDDEDAIDIGESVMLIHGDLGTGERINSILKRRSIEDRPWERFQYAKFCPGFFHVNMACAETLWRITLKLALAQVDETCVMKDLAILRPKETRRISSKFEFRCVHQAIKHIGIARRLDCWRNALQKKYPQFKSLEEFAKTNPKLTDLRAIAKELVTDYVANYKLCSLRMKSESERDEQYENAALVQQYFLLYEELSYSMNAGDIGRLERCLLPWILLFKATGKHKYATAMEKFLVDTHFNCPEPLRHAIRYNILVNPTGKPGKFRGVDWVVESYNCEIKVNHGGQGSNRTVERMITESALIGTFKMINESIESNLMLYTTAAHGDPNMQKTFAELRRNLSQNSPHIFIPGRKSHHCIPDMLNKGAELLCAKYCGDVVNTDSEGADDDDTELRPEFEDLAVELV